MPGLSLTQCPVTQIHKCVLSTSPEKRLIEKSARDLKSVPRPYDAEQGN